MDFTGSRAVHLDSRLPAEILAPPVSLRVHALKRLHMKAYAARAFHPDKACLPF